MSATMYTFRVDGMHCASCSMLIDETLGDLAGVTMSTTSRRDGRTVVEVEEGVSAEQITDAITSLGYRAELTA